MQKTMPMADPPASESTTPLTVSAAAEKIAQPATQPPPAAQVWAYRLWWSTLITFLGSTGCGKLWDRYWHATRYFDTFWSPPHFFVFVMTTITGLLIAVIAFTPKLRVWYGPAVRLPLLPFEIAGSLVILGGGLITLSITITFDNLWHTAYGLDETQWSAPHCMLGWAWLTIVLGFVAARLAFRNYKRVGWLSRLIIAMVILEFLCPAVLGPFYLMYSPHLIHALASIPIVSNEPSAQHMYRIYLHYGLTRQTSDLFIPIVTLFGGIAIALLRHLDARPRVFLLAPFIWSITIMFRDWYTLYFLNYQGAKHLPNLLLAVKHEPSLWVPIPLMVAVVCFYLFERSSLNRRRNLALTGIIFGLCAFFIWHTSSWMSLLALSAIVTTPLGFWLGQRIFTMIEHPTMETLMQFLLSTCAQFPAALGIVDLFMRRNTL
jgi:hypothetical protein